jgi:hypothetical protein
MLLDISVSASKARQKQPAPPQITDNDDATPERVAKGESTFTESGARQFKDELLDRLADSGQLYQGDKIMNAALKLAGERYYEDWYGGGMSTLKAIDYGKVRTGASGSGGGLPVSRMQAQCRDRYRAAREALPAHYRNPSIALSWRAVRFDTWPVLGRCCLGSTNVWLRLRPAARCLLCP